MKRKAKRSCATCHHFGARKGVAGIPLDFVCLAPAHAGKRFCYLTYPESLCELWTEIKTKT